MATSAPSSGLLLGAYELEYLQDAEIVVAERDCLFCGLVVSGEAGALEIEGYGRIKIESSVPFVFCFPSPAVCRSFHKAGSRYASLGIRLTREFFDQNAARGFGEALQPLRAMLEGSIQARRLPSSALLRFIADAALRAPDEDGLQAVYLEGLGLAFLSELCRLAREEDLAESFGLAPAEYARVKRAAEHLEENLQDPPRLSALARRIGVNATTLGRHFQIVHGETIFEYMRNRRLEAARSLLRAGSAGVAQIGYQVGFTNAAAFSTAYRRRYGYPPSQEAASVQASSSPAKRRAAVASGNSS